MKFFFSSFLFSKEVVVPLRYSEPFCPILNLLQHAARDLKFIVRWKLYGAVFYFIFWLCNTKYKCKAESSCECKAKCKCKCKYKCESQAWQLRVIIIMTCLCYVKVQQPKINGTRTPTPGPSGNAINGTGERKTQQIIILIEY